LFYSFILFSAIFVIQFHFAIFLLTDIRNLNSETERVSKHIVLLLVACVLTTYIVTVITRIIGLCDFFKISRKLLSVASFLNYREGTNFSKMILVIHTVCFVSYLIRCSLQLINNSYLLNLLLFLISDMLSETVTSFAEIQFLYFVFTLGRHFKLLNSRLHEIVTSTMTSESIPSFKVHAISELFPTKHSVISALREILSQHVMLCDIFDLINRSYSLQVLAFICSKFVQATVLLYLIFFTIFDNFIHSIRSLLPSMIFEVMQLVTVVWFCKYANFQVGIL
jgi:hypothetical protein